MEGCFWTSRRDNDVTQCYLKFGFIGNLLFVPLPHESAQCQRFPDDTHAVTLFFPKRVSQRQQDRKKAEAIRCPDEITLDAENELLDDKEAQLHADLRDSVNDVFEAILGQSVDDIPNSTGEPAVPASGAQMEDQSGIVPPSAIDPVHSLKEDQNGTIIGTAWIPLTNTSEDQSSTANGTEQTDAKSETVDPLGTDGGTKQTVHGTEPTHVPDSYTEEVNQAVASIVDTNDTDDINATPLQPPEQQTVTPAENNKTTEVSAENLTTGTGTELIANNSDQIASTSHAGLPNSTVAITGESTEDK